MAGVVVWQTDIKKALAMASKESKPILLDFFNPG